MSTKAYTGELKELDEGRGRAVFATLNVVDKDGDVTLPGAFGEQRAKLVGAHQWHLPNIGVATIREEGDLAIADFEFYLGMESAKEWYEALRRNYENGVPQEWSYGFDVLEEETGDYQGKRVRYLKRLKVHEVSPVMVGAGEGTMTLAVKDLKRAVAPHSTATSDAAWDGPANERRVRSGEDLAYYRRIYAWQDPDADPATKSAWRFIHHEIDADGNPGPANEKACESSIGIVNGGMGVDVSVQPWSRDREGIWRHCARHLRDAGKEPPELRSLGDGRMKLADAFESVEASMSEAREIVSRCRALATLRMKEGRVLSRANRERLAKLRELLSEVERDIAALLESAEPEREKDRVAKLYLAYLRSRAQARARQHGG